MKISPLLIILNFYCLSSFSQIFSGQVINRESGEPILFANVGIIGKNIGTVSDAAGWFTIELNSKYDKDTLCISCIGYSKRTYIIRDFKSNIRNNAQTRIELSPMSYHLDEVIVRPIDTRTYTLGYYCDSNSAYGNAFYSKELGTEIGVVVKLPRKKDKAYLKSFRFYVGEFTFDKFPVRLNIYSAADGFPDESILMEPILIEISSAGEYVVDLSKYNITANGNFFVSLEYYRIPDDIEGELVFCAAHNRKTNTGSSYYRWTSQGNWQPEMFDTVGFSVQVECEK